MFLDFDAVRPYTRTQERGSSAGEEAVRVGESEVRAPVQRRAIEKKQRIIEAGFKLFCEQGFHSTNTAEIAREAGVSTGIVYSYFANKKAIFLETIRLYSDLILAPMFQFIAALQPPLEMERIVASLLDTFVASHSMAKDAHEEMMAMSHADADVAKLFHDFDLQTAQTIAETLVGFGFRQDHLLERVHVARGLMEHHCHEVVYTRHDAMDYAAMRGIVIAQVVALFAQPPADGTR